MRKKIITLLSQLAPRFMMRRAYKTLTNPQIRKLREHERSFLQTAEQATLDYAGFEIQTYRWGNPADEKILLIHGWEGQAGNFTDLVPQLLAAQYHVLAFDAPSHGFSSTGPTSLFEFSDLVAKMIRDHQCRKLVSHSFGGVATTYALFRNQDLEIDKYALLTTPDKFTQRINAVAESVGITEKVKSLLIQRLEDELQVDIRQANVSNFVQEIPVKKALILHDKNDRVIPIAQSRHVYENWPECQFLEIEGTGHFRILRTESVIESVIAFMGERYKPED